MIVRLASSKREDFSHQKLAFEAVKFHAAINTTYSRPVVKIPKPAYSGATASLHIRISDELVMVTELSGTE
jgi:hypothetical protein